MAQVKERKWSLTKAFIILDEKTGKIKDFFPFDEDDESGAEVMAQDAFDRL